VSPAGDENQANIGAALPALVKIHGPLGIIGSGGRSVPARLPRIFRGRRASICGIWLVRRHLWWNDTPQGEIELSERRPA
jgi:hypothetical protein